MRLISFPDLFTVRYLWDVRNDDECSALFKTHRAADILVASLGFANH